MLRFVRQRWPWFAAFLLLGTALRLFAIFKYPEVQGDSLVYGDIAKNWLLHGVFGLSTSTGIQPTYIRLPGYPAFLAAMFAVFGMEHYRAAMVAQLLVDLATCFLIAGIAWELGDRNALAGESPALHKQRAAMAAFALAAVCPFTANYVAAPLSETWAIFFTALLLWMAAKVIAHTGETHSTSALRTSAQGSLKTVPHGFLWLGLAIGAAIMLRPDDGILLAIVGGWIVWRFIHGPRRAAWFARGVMVLIGVLVFVAPWTIRNWRTMHRFEPLAPRYANDPEDFVPRGFNRWAKTWIVDFISVYRVYWQVDGEEIDPAQLPERAWGSGGERAKTEAVLARYNENATMTAEIEGQFAELAARRIREHPVLYYLGLPLARVADMWLRPRTELLPIELDWWNYDDHEGESQIAMAMAAVNLILIVLAIAGLVRGRKYFWHEFLWVLILFVVVRSAFLGTLENPEPRYTLEMFPVMLALAGWAFTPRGNQ